MRPRSPSEAVEALRHPHQRRVVGPHTAVDQTVRLHPVSGEEQRRRRSGQSHVHGRHSPVASKIWMVRGAEQMDAIRGQVVARNGDPDPRIAKKPIPKGVLQHRSQLDGVVSRPQESSQQPVTCSPRPWEDAVAVFEIDRQDLSRRYAESKREGDDAASRGPDDEVEVISDRRVEVLFPSRQRRRSEDPAQPASVEREHLEERSARTRRPGGRGIGLDTDDVAAGSLRTVVGALMLGDAALCHAAPRLDSRVHHCEHNVSVVSHQHVVNPGVASP